MHMNGYHFGFQNEVLGYFFFFKLCAFVECQGFSTLLGLHVQDMTHHWSFCPEVTQKYATNPQETEPIKFNLVDHRNID